MNIPTDYNEMKALAAENGYKGKQDKKSLTKFLSSLENSETPVETKAEVKEETPVETKAEVKWGFALNQDVLFPDGLKTKWTKITAKEAEKMPKQWYS